MSDATPSLTTPVTTTADPGASGGGGTTPAQTSGATAPQLPEWLKSINDPELQNDQILHRYPDIPTLAKSLSHAQRALSKDKVPLPGKNATPEEWRQFFIKAGLPETPDNYKI